MSAPVRRRAHAGRRHGSPSIALGLFSLARRRPENLVFPLLRLALAPSSPDVGVPDVMQKGVPIYSEWAATLVGYVNAQIQRQMTGYLISTITGNARFVCGRNVSSGWLQAKISRPRVGTSI